ncbi:MAG: type II toxin-antitoxin system VapC family toxin [Planctomycetota bacterium]
MKQKVYLETSVISYLTSKLSRDLIVAGHQQITQEWWEKRSDDFDLFVSQIVVGEAGKGDRLAAERRLEVVSGLPLLDINEDAESLSAAIVTSGAVPAEAGEDALHIALAIVHGMDYLLTWNFKHIANAELERVLTKISRSLGYDVPVICTPEELMGG